MDQIQRNKEVSSNGGKVVVVLKLLCYLWNYGGWEIHLFIMSYLKKDGFFGLMWSFW